MRRLEGLIGAGCIVTGAGLLAGWPVALLIAGVLLLIDRVT